MPKTSKKARSYIGHKIKKIKADEPGKTQSQVLGKAFGMARQKGLKVAPAKQKKRR